MGWRFKYSYAKIRNHSKKCLKLLLRRTQRYPSNLVFKESNVLDLKQLFFAKCVLESRLEINIRTTFSHNTRQADRIIMEVPKTKTSTAQRCWIFLGPRCFNKLPENIKLLPPKKFKAELKTFLLNSERKTICDQIDLKNQFLI